MTASMGRRELIGRGIALGADALAAALIPPVEAQTAAESLTSLHCTDIRVESAKHPVPYARASHLCDL